MLVTICEALAMWGVAQVCSVKIVCFLAASLKSLVAVILSILYPWGNMRYRERHMFCDSGLILKAWSSNISLFRQRRLQMTGVGALC